MVLTDLDDSVNCTCSENCWCMESLLLPFSCTFLYTVKFRVRFLDLIFSPQWCSFAVTCWIILQSPFKTSISFVFRSPYTSKIRTSLLSKFLIEHGFWVHGYTYTIFYCNSSDTLTSVVISSLINMQGLYIALYGSMVWLVMTHFYCICICFVFCVYVKLLSVQFS